MQNSFQSAKVFGRSRVTDSQTDKHTDEMSNACPDAETSLRSAN